MSSCLDSESDALVSSAGATFSIVQSDSSVSSISPPLYDDTNSPTPPLSWKGSREPSIASKTHIESEQFIHTVNSAINSYPDGQAFDEVKVLAFTWEENNLGLKLPEAGSLIADETDQLMRVFRDLYGYHTEHYRIPSQCPFEHVQFKLANTICDLSKEKASGKKVLFMVYYNGHGGKKDGNLIWAAHEKWALGSPEHPALQWNPVRNILEATTFDVVLFLDCCYAAAAITKGPANSMVILAGSAREVQIPGPGGGPVIGSPFTHTLVKHLREQAPQVGGLLMTELHTLMSTDEVLENQSPIHCVLKGHNSQIRLRSLLKKEKISQATEPGQTGRLTVSFRSRKHLTPEEVAQWLDSGRPEVIAGIVLDDLRYGYSKDNGVTGGNLL